LIFIGFSTQNNGGFKFRKNGNGKIFNQLTNRFEGIL